MTTKALNVTPELQDYILANNPPEPELLARLARETDVLPRASMRVGWPQGRAIMVLLQLMGARRAVEVGVFTGYSSLCAAMALPADGLLVALDHSPEWTDVAKRYWREAGVDHKVELRLGPALDSLEAMLAAGLDSTFDFAFIDADKVNYKKYYERCLKLLRPGGLIAVDNTLWYGRVIDETFTDPDTEAVRAFNACVRGDDRVTLCMTPIGDGMTLAVKK